MRTASVPANEFAGVDEFAFSIVRGGPMGGLLARVGMADVTAAGLARRCAVLVGLTWLPVMIAGVAVGPGANGED